MSARATKRIPIQIPKHFHPLSLDELNNAWTKVWRELESLGFTCPRLAKCQVNLGVNGREYAAESTGEDFAEVFWKFLKHKGKLPKHHHTKPIIKKWQFVDSLRKV